TRKRNVKDVASRFRPQRDAISRLERCVRRADGPLKFQQLFRRQRFSALQDSSFPFAAAPPFIFFGPGEGQGSGSEDFVDFSAVEQIARTFVGDPGVVVKDDGGAKHAVPFRLCTDKYRPHPDVAAVRGDSAEILGWIEKRNELSVANDEYHVSRYKRRQKV